MCTPEATMESEVRVQARMAVSICSIERKTRCSKAAGQAGCDSTYWRAWPMAGREMSGEERGEGDGEREGDGVGVGASLEGLERGRRRGKRTRGEGEGKGRRTSIWERREANSECQRVGKRCGSLQSCRMLRCCRM